MENIFSLKNSNFENLYATSSVEFFRKLIWAEAFRLGVSYKFINISSRINVPDGGVDARISCEVSKHSSLIRKGINCYQIKSGKTFSPWQKSEIQKEFFGSERACTKNLNTSIKNCMNENGTYFIICTGIDIVDDDLVEAKKHMDYFLRVKCKYKSPNYEIYSINNLISFIEPFYPSLCLEIKGITDARFQTHKSWFSDYDMGRPFFIDQKQKLIIEDIRNVLTSETTEAEHIRILGDPGIGKTRLILEVTSRDDIKDHVIYTNAQNFVNGNLLNEILKSDNNFNVCLVLDECDENNKYIIWNKLKSKGNRVKIITINNELKNLDDPKLFLIKPLSSVEVSQIINSYGVPLDQAKKFSSLCDGSPRVAHVLGENLKNHPEDLMRTPDYIDVWNRYIQDPRLSNEENNIRILILEYISLFKKWGYKDNSRDFDYLLDILKKADNIITKDYLIRVVDNFKRKKILQGEYILYITPKLLHIWLWNEFWKKNKDHFIKDDFIKELNSSLLENFYNMFEYAHSSETSTMVKELLSEKGPFNNDEFLKTRIGSSFFLNLAKVNPKDSLAALIRIFENKSLDDLLNFKEGRREIITILAYTGQFKELFRDSILLLFKLALAENEGYSNNASGVFADFFSMGMGKLATTELPPLDRIKILEEILKGKEKGTIELVIKAVGCGLMEKMFKSVGLEGVSLLNEPLGWSPNTRSEIIDAKREYWELLFSEFDHYSLKEKSLVYEIINNSLYYIGKEKELTELVINTLKKIINNDDSIKEKLLHTIIRSYKWINQNDPEEIGKQWGEFCDYLENGDFNSQMKRFVFLNILEDEYDENGKRINKLDNKLNEFAEIYLTQKKYLDDDFNWLFTKQASNSYRFGYFLSKKDKDNLIFDYLMKNQEKIRQNFSLSLLSGYLKGLYEQNIQKRDDIILKMSKNENKLKWIPEIACHSGLTDNMVLLLIELFNNKKINLNDFEYLRYGSVLENISENIFSKLIETLVSVNNANAYSMCLNFWQFYNEKVNETYSPSKKLGLKILLNIIHGNIERDKHFHQLDDFYFEIICNKYLKSYSQDYYIIAKRLIKSFGNNNSITYNPHSNAINILNNIIQSNPKEIWELIVDYIGPPIDNRAFKLRNWLRGNELFVSPNHNNKPSIEYIPIKEVFKWVDLNPDVRAWHLATFVPNKMFIKENEICFAREVLVRYGNDDKVKRNLRANFMTEGWTGPGSVHYEFKKQELLEFKKNEKNSNVINWIDEYIAILDANIKREKIEEERMDL